MLGPGRYLLGVAEIAWLLGFAWLGAARVRSRLLPRFRGAPAHLATSIVALALLVWVAEALGTVSLFKPLPYLLAVASLGVALRVTIRDAPTASPAEGVVGTSWIVTAGALLVALLAVVHFAAGVKTRLSTGMTGFDSTWYHGPFAAGFFQSGNTWSLHFIAPQFLAWFYPANGELFHAVGMLAFGRDILSPLLNLGWFLGCLVACGCIGRPYRVAPWSLALGAVALSVPALSDQAGEARNDIVGIFFLLTAVAVALNASAARDVAEDQETGASVGWNGLPTGALLIVGLAAGLAAGTKLNFLLSAAVLVGGLAALAPRAGRWRALAVGGLAALAGGGYWYLRNLAHSGSPLPWIHHLGPIALPAPEQGLGGREAHSVLGYLGDGSVWSNWFLPGLHNGLWVIWPALLAGAGAGLLLAVLPPRSVDETASGVGMRRQSRFRGSSPSWPRYPVLAVAGLAGLASALAWLIAPTSASGPEGMPHGFESGLRYLAPALVLGLSLLPDTPLLRQRLANLAARQSFFANHATKKRRAGGGSPRRRWIAAGAALALVAVLVGYPIQRHYLQRRYADPSFTAPGLDAAFAWARDVSGARIATTSTRQYPLYGTDLSNHVQFVGVERPHGGFEAPSSCRKWRELLDQGNYGYVVASRDRLEPGRLPYPPQARWTEGAGAKVVLRKPPTVVFRLTAPPDPSSCPS
jgi:hypothetical protein